MDNVAPAEAPVPSSPTKNICGICGSQVTNQGVLDCCQHLFCFTCIDDWASVTNLCPLCNLRFRLITCLPGTAQHGNGDGGGDGKEGEPGGTSDAEQIHGDGMHPAFYIDEEAVTCLDGDDCLVRSGVSMEVETDSSVACDSCDRWYHAGCVGFDTTGCNQGSWWCPRCPSSGSLNDQLPGGSQLPAAPSTPADFFGLQSQPSVSSAQAGTLQPQTGTSVCNPQSLSPSVNPTSSGTQGAPLNSKADSLRSPVETKVSATKSKPLVVDGGESNPRKRSRKYSAQALEDFETGPVSYGNKPEKRSRLVSAGGEGIDDLLEIVRDDSGRAMAGEAADEPPTGSGVRTRIIMHRAENNGQSLVEEIRHKMRAEAGYGAAADLGKVKVSDARFLAAYKAAIAGKDRREEQVKRKAPKGNSWVVKALKNGASVRDNLTRKLYGGLGGRRMWDRDWDVAFWRGNRQNSKSDSANKLQEAKGDGDSDALKVHIADSSLFPRKDESEVATNSGGQLPVDLNGINRIGAKGSAQQSKHEELLLRDSKRSGRPISGPGNPSSSGSECDRVRKKVRFSDEEPAARLETCSGVGNQKSSDRAKLPGTVHDPSNLNVRDKRMWALEVLARKTGEFGASGARGNTNKGKSLVELLPPELRPSIGINIHSKVPSGVRQVQLDRFLEYELKGSGVRRDPRSARCEQAVKVAVAKEQEIYEKSNSKSVYLNLCANFCANLSARATARKAKSNASLQDTLSESKVRLALEAAGLGFDSDSEADCSSGSRAKKLAAGSLVASEALEVGPSNQVAGEGAPLEDAPVNVMCTDANTLVRHCGALPDDLVAPSSPMLCTPSKDHLTLNAESCGSAMPDSLAQESSPLFMDGIFVLDGEELEVPLLSGSVGNTAVQKDCVPKVKVVLTTIHKFKQDLIAGEGGTASERQEDLAQMAAVDGATSSPQADACRVSVITPEQCPPIEAPDSGCSRDSETPQQESAECENQHDAPEGSAAGGVDTQKEKEGEVEAKEAGCLQIMSTTSPLVKGESDMAPAPDEETDADVNSKDLLSCQVKLDETNKQASAEAESEVDDWMKAGRFPNLESRIDEVRESVLKKGADMLHLLTEYPRSTGDIVDPQGSCLKADCAETSLEGEKKSEIAGAEPHETELVEKQVHAYVREHLRPLHRSGVINTKDYKWAAAKTVSKVMQHHPDARSADFLIVEGSKVKKLADDYLKALTMRKV